MATDSTDKQEVITKDLENNEFSFASQSAKREKDLKHLIPPDMEVSDESRVKVEEIVNSWTENEQMPENIMAKELLVSLLRRVDAWTP